MPFSLKSVNSDSLFCVAAIKSQWEFQILTHVASTTDCILLIFTQNICTSDVV